MSSILIALALAVSGPADLATALPLTPTGLCGTTQSGESILPWRTRPIVKLPDGRRVKTTTARTRLPQGVIVDSSVLQLPAGSKWMGMPALRFETRVRTVPESHASQETAIVLAASFRQIRVSIGRPIATAPEWTSFDDEKLGPHGGAERIERAPGGSRIVCLQTF